MALRDFILHNFRWKLSALILATLVWFVIQFAILVGFSPAETPEDYRNYTFLRQPVMMLTSQVDTQAVRITPPRVDVVVRSTPSALNRLTESDIKTFISLVDVPEGLQVTREVLVYVPEGVEVYQIQVDPPAVKVERISPPEP